MWRERAHTFRTAKFHRQDLRVGQNHCAFSQVIWQLENTQLYSLPIQPLLSFPFSSFSPRPAFLNRLPFPIVCLLLTYSILWRERESHKGNAKYRLVLFIHKGKHDQCMQITSCRKWETVRIGGALLWLCWLEHYRARMLLGGNDLYIGECGLGTFLSQGN